jgi:predicted RecB family nuclease
VVLPLPSLSLKVVEDYFGFERKEAEYGGAWAMATFIEATEISDEGKRKELMDKIVAYNREDLEATWTELERASEDEAAQKVLRKWGDDGD